MENSFNRYAIITINNPLKMNIYKLKYTDKETAIADLIAKRVYDNELNYMEGIHAVVEIGLITLVEGDLETEPIYVDGYHYDVMSEQDIEFENKIEVKNPKHMFAGY